MLRFEILTIFGFEKKVERTKTLLEHAVEKCPPLLKRFMSSKTRWKASTLEVKIAALVGLLGKCPDNVILDLHNLFGNLSPGLRVNSGPHNDTTLLKVAAQKCPLLFKKLIKVCFKIFKYSFFLVL